MSNVAAAPGLAKFRAAVSSLRLHDEPGGVEIDGVSPTATVWPEDEQLLADVLCGARNCGLSVIAVGGGAHLSLGNVPDACDVAVSTARLDGTIDHEPDDLTVIVDAGVRVSDLQARLAEHGQMLPIDPPCAEGATIGGVLAANAQGSLRHAYGTLRDWVIGMRVAGADGRVTKSGGRVVKNVTGYDMHKLHIGALGTLGVITQATFKLAPLPHASETLVAGFARASDACGLILRARDAGLALHAAEALSPHAAETVLGDARWSAVLRLGGSDAAVARSMRDLRMLTADTGGRIAEHRSDVWSRWAAAFAPRRLSLRGGVLPSQAAETLDALDGRLARAAPKLSATVAAGVVRADLDCAGERAGALAARARETFEERRGTMIIDAAPLALKEEQDVFGAARADIELMRRLKREFDPDRTLSPGRFIGRI